MITIGSKVQIKSRSLHDGIVLEVKDNFAQVAIENKTEWFPIHDLVEKSDELLNRMLKKELDDPLDFILAMDAYRLMVEQLWNPYVFASSTKIRIFPHQIDEVIWALDQSKMLIADEVGLGKTIIAALVASELNARGLAQKILYVVPKSLVTKWQDELNEKFGVDSKIVDGNYMKTNDDVFKKEEYSYISSIDFLKQKHIMDKIPTDIDLVVIDEAHKLKQDTERYTLGEKLAENSNFMIMLTATPHDGKDEDFIDRIKLLDPFVTDIPSSQYLWVRNIKEDVRDINGKTVFPPRQSKTVNILLNGKEKEIHQLLDDYLQSLSEQAQDPKEWNAVRFLRIIFRKRGSSSINALKISLTRRLEKLGQVDLNTALRVQQKIQSIEEEGDGDEEDQYENFEGYTPGKNISKEKEHIRNILNAIDELKDVDSKIQELFNEIKNFKSGDPKAKLVIFTEYRDTLEYLNRNLSEKYKVGRIDGSMNIDERKKSLNEFKLTNGVEILLCTDAAGEGIDMQFCNIEINYDLPWNPNRLEQRMGRIHRIGQIHEVYYINFVLDKNVSIDGYILSRLLDKIENIKAAMKDKVYDILGSLISQEDIVKLYEDLAATQQTLWEPKITEFLEKIEQNRNRIQEKSETLLTGHRLDKTSLERFQNVRRHAVDKGEVKRFLQTYLETNEGKLEEIDSKEERYKIYPPAKIARSSKIDILEGTFDSDISIRKNYPYIALGNKNVNRIIQAALRPGVTVLKHPTKSGLLGIYKLSVIDGRGIIQNEKIEGVFHNEDGKISEIDVRSLWDYERAESSDIIANLLVSETQRLESYVNDELKKFHGETAKKLEKAKQSSISIMTRYYSNKGGDLDNKINEYMKKLGEGPHIQQLITRAQNNKQKLFRESKEKIAEIEIKFKSNSAMELIGLAKVIPDLEANIRTEVEHAGMSAVIEYERKRALNEEERKMIRDVSTRDCGYDIESFGGRCIEVKSFAKTGGPRITSHEWETARRLQNDYWLYIVENALDKPQVHTFQNPYEKFKDKVRKELVIDYRYIIDDWKTKL